MTYSLPLIMIACMLVELCHSTPERFYASQNNDNMMPMYVERRLSKFRGEPVRFGKRAAYREPIRFGKRFMPINQMNGYGLNAVEGN
ncbi:unnamed protein product [Bursaphelenchus okinawaensis]|uniref:Uncharacterized protein n=1 Tax=Bursaphelenchus okinawaensis TaxID=465554 RepID=A0A811KQE1_9BILA|nr:unnamed protein product [Bursaphelenchus okinawaensis]CAG9107966.1 unnamed protein product [Bursaphelenchus okinawaensis]